MVKITRPSFSLRGLSAAPALLASHLGMMVAAFSLIAFLAGLAIMFLFAWQPAHTQPQQDAASMLAAPTEKLRQMVRILEERETQYSNAQPPSAYPDLFKPRAQ